MHKQHMPFFNKCVFSKKLFGLLNNSNYLSRFKEGAALAIITYCIDLIVVDIPNARCVTATLGIVSHDAINRHYRPNPQTLCSIPQKIGS
ncbi:hypothetical protein [Mahella australiensis]|uniref:Uncharacterized protein n=1 Tax=Mahella australiensis (strain DSM 15567 / CIP 107919 / 50-1 BON) TaxID=697281 RepID=F3ZVQ9_MAHA5|nr:hypothetical protein [Mahella australiensis]AEE97453.1 hypothetical protein Mahau_2285 [Mahella australiensis 50-1 BON]